MNRNKRKRRAAAAAGAAVTLAAAAAAAAPFKDQLVQPPSIGQPQRGSTAGSLSRLAFGPAELARGAHSLPLRLPAPSERGPLLADVVPSYSAEGGAGEWGVGWQAELAIRRHRAAGEIDFTDDDEFTSPWGHLVAGDDGAYYPAGLRSMVRLERADDGWRATTSDGTVYRFDAADASAAPGGTYAWNLSRVDNLLGDSTSLSWSWNDSGRAFLAEVRWGGRGDGTHYRMAFDYETIAVPFASYVSGKLVLLDRRVARVTTSVRQGGAYAERWRHDLAYVNAPTGPAFYLARVTRRYASGAADPPVTYAYDFSSDQLATATFQSAPALDGLFASYGSGAIQPDKSAMTDLERNGLTDLEVQFDQTLVRQTEAGYVFEPLPPAAGGENPLCRPAPGLGNKPRLLARMHGDAEQPQVVVTAQSSTGAQTRFLVCDRAGMPQFDQALSGAWGLGANTRLADLDLDQRPDVVRVGFGSAQVLKNVSASPTSIAFAPGATTALSPKVTPVSSWVLDVNGDGRPDLMVRHAGGVIVWRGVGGGRFEPNGTTHLFTTAAGAPLAGLSTYEFSHGDFNNDGLSDLILTKGQTVLLFTNRGRSFVQTPVAAFASIPWTVSFPVVADLSGSGNEQIVMAAGTSARVLQLSRPSTGLLTRADDGKGTVIAFDYGRVRPAPGVDQLYSVLASMKVASSGYDPVTYKYEYGAPVWHTLGKYLVGFADARKASPHLKETVSFYNDDDIAGVVTGSRDEDGRTPGLERFSARGLERTTFHGVPWLRVLWEEGGWRAPGGGPAVASRTDYLAYERGVCPTVTETAGPHGVLRQETTLGSAAELDPELSCLVASQRSVGRHADAALDFDYRLDVERDGIGRLRRATQAGPAGPITLQEVTYDGAGRVASVSAAGAGTSTYAYDATTGQLATVTKPDGVVETVVARDPLTDALVQTRVDHGGAAWSNFAAYDGLERLQKTWDDLSGADAAHPLSQIAYVYATAGAPGRILERRLVDAASGAATDVAEIMAADGAVLAKAALQPGGWSLTRLTRTDRNALTTSTFARGPLASLNGLNYAGLFAGATPLGVATSTGAGGDFASWSTVQDGVTGQRSIARTIASGELVTATTENLAHVTRTGSGVDGRPRWFQDQNGATTAYDYDAMGRLRRVRTPGGGQHRLDYDGYGRPAVAERQGVQRVEWTYAPGTGLMVARRERSAAGALDRTTTYEHDAIGRLARTREVKAATGEARTVTTYWDGARPAGAPLPGQRGFATAVRTDQVTKLTTRGADGRVAQVRWELDGWRSVAQSTEYYANGAIGRATMRVENGAGAKLVETVKEFDYDAFGRLARCRVNGDELYSLAYDADGRTQTVRLADGEVTLAYDPTTRGRRGYTMTGEIAGAVHWDRDARGLTSRETFDVNGDALHRQYGYDARGFLTSTTDEAGTASYEYDAAGLIASASDGLGARPIDRSPGEIMAGAERHELDASGRVVARGDLTVEYGPSGELERARRGSLELRFAYDEAGQRVLKYRNGAPVAAYVEGAYLDATKLVEPVVVEGVALGVLENGTLRRLAFDPRGTALSDEAGELSAATPYGARQEWGPLAEAVDYVQKGYDRDLGLVRMGVRDYDPLLGQFWTPDPLFLTSPERCVGSPAECNLYGYAKNDPVGFVDPTGTDAKRQRMPHDEKENEKAAAALRQKTGLPVEPDHPLNAGTRVATPIDYAVTMLGLRMSWMRNNLGNVFSATIPQKDLAEIEAILRTLPAGTKDWHFKTSGGYEVRFVIVLPVAGELSDSSTSVTNGGTINQGASFKEHSQQSSKKEVNFGATLGKEDVAGVGVGGKVETDATRGRENTTESGAENSHSSSTTYPHKVRSESGAIMVGVHKDGMEPSWSYIQSYREDPTPSFVIQTSVVPAPATGRLGRDEHRAARRGGAARHGASVRCVRGARRSTGPRPARETPRA